MADKKKKVKLYKYVFYGAYILIGVLGMYEIVQMSKDARGQVSSGNGSKG